MEADYNYGINWDLFYQQTLNNNKTKALWDVPASLAAAKDFEQFKNDLTNDLPIIDLGCGTGTQSLFFAQFYPQVIGLDVSQQAIDYAEHNSAKKNISFDIFNGLDRHKAREIHQQWGDVHIYMRGVFHQILPSDQVNFIEVIKIFLGQQGKLFLCEVSDNIRTYFSQENGTSFSQLPTKLKAVFISHLPPRGVSLRDLTESFPERDFSIISMGNTQLYTNIKIKDSEPIFIPAVYAIITPKSH
ncbi:MAG: methyltransferase domain-containing protein [Methyloprofundus sp.]|nr:methyltransferase domain-containing protein [Methyloprofundus sp.]